jgi:glutamate transport system substrate-binding protein
MKRTTRGARCSAALVVALGLLLGGCTEPGEEAADCPAGRFEAGTTMARLAQADRLRVGTKFDQPLFGLKGLTGKPEGFDVEIAKMMACALGIQPGRIRWVETPSAVREEKIVQGAVDMIVATYTINDKRRQRVSFAGPYYEAGQDLMVKKANTTITGSDSLRPLRARVCSVSGSTPAERIKNYIDGRRLVLFDVYSKCADALRTGQVDAVTTDNVVLLGLIDQTGKRFKLVGKPFNREPYGIGIKKGDVKFCEFIDSVLRQAAQDGRYQAAWERTAGKVAGSAPPLPRFDTCS